MTFVTKLVEQNSNDMAKIQELNFDTTIPKLEITDSKSIVSISYLKNISHMKIEFLSSYLKNS